MNTTNYSGISHTHNAEKKPLKVACQTTKAGDFEVTGCDLENQFLTNILKFTHYDRKLTKVSAR